MSPAAAPLAHRARRGGQSFERAWSEALPVALAQAVTTEERSQWAQVLGGTVLTWRAAWERRPATSPERALITVADRGPGVALPERQCERCGQPIPLGRGRGRVRYCSDRCKQAVNYQRLCARAGA